MNRNLLLLLVAVLPTLLFVPAPAGAADPLSVVVTSLELSRYPEASAVVQVGGPPSVKSRDLGPEAFELKVDGQRIEQLEVAAADSMAAPIATTLLIDESGSMKGEPMVAAAQAARRFIEGMREGDQVALHTFDEEFRVLQEMTGDKNVLIAALEKLTARRETGLYDAVIQSLKSFGEPAEGVSRYLVILSDGGDTASSSTLEQATAQVRASGAQVYTVGLKGDEFDATPLSRLAEVGGGRYLETPDTAKLVELYAGLSKELHTAYLVNFRLPESGRRETGQLSLSLTHEDESAVAVKGFFYPTMLSPPEPAQGESDRAISPVVAEQPKALPAFLRSFVAWDGSIYSIVASIFGLIFIAGYLLSGVLFPKRSVLTEYSDILDNRRNLAPRDKEKLKQRPGEKMVSRVLRARGYQDPLQQRMEDAGWQLRTSEFALFHLLGVALVGIFFWILGTAAILTISVVLLAVAGPLVFVDSRARNRRKQFEAQVPDTLTILANALRAGQGFEQAMQVVAAEGPNPTATEFKRLLAQQQLGVSPEEALRTLAERMKSQAFDWVVMATVIQRQVGGNLAEIYDSIADTLRERESLKREVATLTAEGRMSALILILLPVGVAFFIQVLNPEYMSVMFTTDLGLVMVGATVVAMISGIVWIRSIIRFDL